MPLAANLTAPTTLCRDRPLRKGGSKVPQLLRHLVLLIENSRLKGQARPPRSSAGATAATGTDPSKPACPNVSERTILRTQHRDAARASPASRRSSPGGDPATPEPPRCGIHGTTTKARPASSNLAETAPKNPFLCTWSTVLRPFQPSLRRPGRLNTPEDDFLHRKAVFSPGSRTG